MSILEEEMVGSAEENSSYNGSSVIKSNKLSLGRSRQVALAEVDNARFSWFHVKVCFVAGIGFFTDAYDIFAINIASTMLGYVYGKDDSRLSPTQELAVKVATPVGNFFGQLLFGWLADKVGRKRMYGVELMIMVIGAFAQTLSGQAPSVNVISALVIWRFIMGVGVGGDYPMSSLISSEFAATTIRGRMMTAVFANQGWGNLAACIVALVVTATYKHAILGDTFVDGNLNSIDPLWRLLIGFGNLQQASSDIKDVMTRGRGGNDGDSPVQRVDVPKATWVDFARYFGKWQNGKVLLGAAYSWFALDVAFYGLGLNSSMILHDIISFGGGTPKDTQGFYHKLYDTCLANLILSVAGLIPGYWATFLCVDSWGRKPIQLMGFSVLTIIFIIMGFGYDKLTTTAASQDAFVFLYCLANFFQNFGPNSTTFIVPGEVFPTRYRSTGHGISAASGKLGAIVAQVIVTQIGGARLRSIESPNPFVKRILQIFSIFMLTGVFSTLLIPETKKRTLEELSNEDQEVFVRTPT
ncbi:hypothetical protein Ac2012v2_006765 [Leucoagaricus gongylophorus]